MRCMPAGPFMVLAAVFGATRAVAADTTPPVPVTVSVVGSGEIRLIVADGASRPCDASDNRVLFNRQVRAGDEIKLSSLAGSVCVDHTFGALRQSQWAGASIWSGGASWPGSHAPAIHGTISTEEP
jgi:hypothetical protein